MHGNLHALFLADFAAPELLTPESAVHIRALRQPARNASLARCITTRFCLKAVLRMFLQYMARLQAKDEAEPDKESMTSSTCLCELEKVLYVHTCPKIPCHPLKIQPPIDIAPLMPIHCLIHIILARILQGKQKVWLQ